MSGAIFLGAPAKSGRQLFFVICSDGRKRLSGRTGEWIVCSREPIRDENCYRHLSISPVGGRIQLGDGRTTSIAQSPDDWLIAITDAGRIAARAIAAGQLQGRQRWPASGSISAPDERAGDPDRAPYLQRRRGGDCLLAARIAWWCSRRSARMVAWVGEDLGTGRWRGRCSCRWPMVRAAGFYDLLVQATRVSEAVNNYACQEEASPMRRSADQGRRELLPPPPGRRAAKLTLPAFPARWAPIKLANGKIVSIIRRGGRGQGRTAFRRYSGQRLLDLDRDAGSRGGGSPDAEGRAGGRL